MLSMPRPGRRVGRVLLIPLLLLAVTGAAADQFVAETVSTADRAKHVLPEFCPRVADPKLDGGEIPVAFTLVDTGEETLYDVRVTISCGNLLVRRLAEMSMPASPTPVRLLWDGRDEAGRYVSPGEYRILVSVGFQGMVERIGFRVNIVRLGITGIEALPGDGDEWQMVYFRKGSQYQFYATPAIHEYCNVASGGEVSDLDQDNGNPRPVAALHTGTASPVLDGSSYETACYNYPLCYLVGSSPRFRVTLGDSCTRPDGSAGGCGYPVPGVQIRGVARDAAGDWESAADTVRPGEAFIYDGPELPDRACRTDRAVTWRWQYRELNGKGWQDIPGRLVTEHRFYTIVNEPYWPSGASGTQYAGPWIEVADYLSTYADTLKINTQDEAGTVRALIRGFFGQEGPLDTAIEDVVYDCYSMGGDGGATHYFSFYSDYVQLSRLLNNHANGRYVNCSDVGASTSVMLGMLGVQNVRMLYLGSMSLYAIWGIGCPDYTLDLWSGGHGFSYHHIITRDNGTHVSDACMWVDEDGSPGSLPGVPGYNHDRPWSGSDGYNTLSASNNVSKTLDTLPDIQ